MADGEWKILLIDKDEQSPVSLGTALREQGWTLVTAKDISVGLERFRTEAPDLVLVACCPSGADGGKRVRLLRELDGEVPIIALSAEESREAADRLFEAGASDLVLKPIRLPDFVSRIRLHIRLLESRKHLRYRDGVRVADHKAKGIGAVTLDLIQGAFRTTEEYLTVETIAERTGLAYQTTYRYLQHLAAQNRVEVCQNYGKIGRPKQKYRLRERNRTV